MATAQQNNTQNEQNTKELKQHLTFEDDVIKKIAAISTSKINGIISMSGGIIEGFAERLGRSNITKGIDAEVGEKQVAIDLKVIVEYGHDIPSLFEKTTKEVKSAIKNMTGLEVVEVNMHVEDILTKEEQKEDQDSKNENNDRVE